MAQPNDKPTAAERVKAYGIVGVSALALLKLPLVVVGIVGAVAVGVASTQVGLAATLTKIKDVAAESFALIGRDVKSLLGSVDKSLTEEGPKAETAAEPKSGALKGADSKTSFDKSAARPANDAVSAPAAAPKTEMKRKP